MLLGDKDQLASVEAGAVLADVCGDAPGFTPAMAARMAGLVGSDIPSGTASGSPLRDSVVLLRESRRFASRSGIAELAAAVNRGDGPAALTVLAGSHPDVAWQQVPDVRAAGERLAAAAIEGFARYLELVRSGAPTAEIFAAFAAFRILCPHRAGSGGVEAVNRLVESALAARGLIRPLSAWYSGRPVMVTRNDHTLGLSNGDVGIVLPDPADRAPARVAFPAPDD